MRRARKFRLHFEFPSLKSMNRWVELAKRLRMIPETHQLREACQTEEDRREFTLHFVDPFAPKPKRGA